jgi:uncharacterized protein (TIGR03435 family)
MYMDWKDDELEQKLQGFDLLKPLPPLRLQRRTYVRLSWVAAGLTAAILIGVGVYKVRSKETQKHNTPAATVEAIDLELVRLGANPHPMHPGDIINENEVLRSNGNSGEAEIRLLDGSSVEMGPNAELSMESVGDSVRIHLRTGTILINATERSSGHLHVQSKDCTVSVTGTVFAVSSLPAGSRVSVIQGRVSLEQGASLRVLLAGQQATTSSSIPAVSVESEISWSHRISTSQTRPQFEAVILRPSAPNARGSGGGLLPGGKFRARNLPLKYFIAVAYRITRQEVFGNTDLIDSRYDLDAEAGRPVDGTQISLMLQSALENEIGLKFHRETRELPIYSLTVLKPGVLGPNFTKDEAGDCALATGPEVPPPGATAPLSACGGVSVGPGRISGRRSVMWSFTDRLSVALERPVIDKTGITGYYDITLTWTPDPTPGQKLPKGIDPLGPTLFTAIQQQLGLKLESGKQPIEIIVVDSVRQH